jgi:SAM-dependent methyltransferase
MRGVNIYWQRFKSDESSMDHREAVGGLWEKVGLLQMEFMKSSGLTPNHRFLDIGCGSLRGGIHFVDYLAPGNYYGLDVNASLLDAGREELKARDLLAKSPHLLADEAFRFSLFDTRFDYALAVSVFTHLPSSHLSLCFAELREVLNPDGKFYFTYFEAPHSGHHTPIAQQPGGITSYPDRDPFHYSREDLVRLASPHGIGLEFQGDWGHPRGQLMACGLIED